MWDDRVLIDVEPERMLGYMGDLISTKKEFEKLKSDVKGTIKDKLGLELTSSVKITKNYRALSNEEMDILRDIQKKDTIGELSNDFLNSASNRLAVVIAIAIAVAAVAVKVKLFE